MDFIQDWLPRVLHLQDQQPPSHLHRALSVVLTVRNYTMSLLNYISTAQPSLATVALLLVILWLSLQILNMAWRAVKFWVSLVTRLLFYGGIVGLVMWAWSRGPDGVIEDAQHWVIVWWGEYERYQRQAEALQGPGGLRREGFR